MTLVSVMAHQFQINHPPLCAPQSREHFPIANVKHPPLPDLLSSPPIHEFSSIPSNPILDEDFFPVTRPAMTISRLDKVPLSHDHCRHLPHLPPWIATLLRLLAVLLLPPCWWPTGSLLGMQLSWQNPCQACRKSWAQSPALHKSGTEEHAQNWNFKVTLHYLVQGQPGKNVSVCLKELKFIFSQACGTHLIL